MAWEYETFGPDGQCKLFGVNIFDYILNKLVTEEEWNQKLLE